MNVLHFDSSINQESPLQTDYSRVVNYDENGNEFISWEPVDYPSIQASNGLVSDWSLNSLMSAGINPNFSIHTGNPTRIEGIDTINDAIRIADEILSENNDSTPKND